MCAFFTFNRSFQPCHLQSCRRRHCWYETWTRLTRSSESHSRDTAAHVLLLCARELPRIVQSPISFFQSPPIHAIYSPADDAIDMRRGLDSPGLARKLLCARELSKTRIIQQDEKISASSVLSSDEITLVLASRTGPEIGQTEICAIALSSFFFTVRLPNNPSRALALNSLTSQSHPTPVACHTTATYYET